MKKLLPKSPLFLLLLILCTNGLYAQSNEDLIRNFNQTRIQYNKQGMVILGSWAIGNIVWGGVMAGRTTGEIQGFHQMNAYWNTVNLLIAGVGYYSALKEEPGTDFWGTIQSQQSIEKILLVNAALDVAYMAGGLYMLERGRRTDNPRLSGFGQSVILQGAFLMSFDLIKFMVHNKHGKKLPGLLEGLSMGPGGMGFRMTF